MSVLILNNIPAALLRALASMKRNSKEKIKNWTIADAACGMIQLNEESTAPRRFLIISPTLNSRLMTSAFVLVFLVEADAV
jgi:hypothetical protein